MAAVVARPWLPVAVRVASGAGIGLVIAHLVGRPRPAPPFAVLPIDGFSFPSGHATGAAAVGLVGAWMLGAAWAAAVIVIASWWSGAHGPARTRHRSAADSAPRA